MSISKQGTGQTSHIRQVMAVFQVYASWWLTWLVLALDLFGLTFLIVTARQSDTRFNHGPNRVASSVELSQGGQPLDRLPVDLTSVEGIVLGSIQLEAALQPNSLLQTPGRLPNLKHVSLFASLTEPQLVELLQHQRLRSMQLISLPPLTDRGIAALKIQPIEELQFLSMDRSNWATAPWPETLRKLLVHDNQQATDNPSAFPLEPLVKLPNLETLQIRLLPDANGRLSASDRDALQSMSALKTLYLQGADSKFVAQAQTEIPRIAVRPGVYKPERVYRVLTILAMGLLPLLLIVHIVSLQYLTPASMLMPDFDRGHWRTAVGLFLACGIIQAVALRWAGCAWLSCVSLANVPLVWIVVITFLFERWKRFPGYTHVHFLLFAAVPAWIPLLLVLTRSAEFDWMIEGYRPDIAGMAVALEIVSLLVFKGCFACLCRRLSEHTEGSVPYGIVDFRELAAWNMQGSKNQPTLQDRVWGAGQRRRLAAAVASDPSSASHQALLWRAGQPMPAWGFAVWMAGVMSVGFLVVLPFLPAVPLWNVLSPIGLQIGLFVWMIPVILLMQQRAFLERHMLSSCGRRDWVQLIFRETARDFIPPLITVIVGLLAYHAWGPKTYYSTSNACGIALSLLLLVYGITLLLPTCSTAVQMAIVGVAIISTPVVVFAVATFSSWPLSPSAKAIVSLPPVWWSTIFISSGLMIRWAYRRWMAWELGLIQS